MNIYPLKFKTIYKDKIWGGEKVKTMLGKDFDPLPNCGETWELSAVEGNISLVSNGPLKDKSITEVIAEYQSLLVGDRVYKQFGTHFPLLVKFLDAREDLSVQVHPNDELASMRHQSYGKSEMWYIVQADDNSSLISGFNQPVNKDSFREACQTGQLYSLLNQESAQAGDVFYLPAGRVHTIGKGLLLAEIQQTSDVTYRIYDFERLDNAGNIRELHIEAAVDAIDYQLYDSYKTAYQDRADSRVELVKCPYFTTNKLWLTRNFAVDHSGLDCFKIYVCLQGSASIRFENGSEHIHLGEVILVPAAIKKYTLETSEGAILLESYIDY